MHRHHVIPRYLVGSSNEYNIIVLTKKEHILIHRIRWKIYKDLRELLAVFLLGGCLNVAEDELRKKCINNCIRKRNPIGTLSKRKTKWKKLIDKITIKEISEFIVENTEDDKWNTILNKIPKISELNKKQLRKCYIWIDEYNCKRSNSNVYKPQNIFKSI